MDYDKGRFFSREELYELIWSKPIVQLARKFVLSDVALAKKCKHLGIPRPDRGYWAKIANNHKVNKSKLPPLEKDKPDRIWISTPSPEKKTEPYVLSESVCKEIDTLRLPENHIAARTDFRGSHHLTRQTRSVLRRGRKDDYGRLFAVIDKPFLDVSVSRGTLDRTLLLFDAILMALEDHGFTINTDFDSWGRCTHLIRGQVTMSLSAFERADRTERKVDEKQKREFWWTIQRYDYAPSGKIEFRLDRSWPFCNRRWVSLKSVTLEERLTDIVCEIIESAELLEIALKRQEEKEQRERDEQRRQIEQRQLRTDEHKRRSELLQQSIDWETANRIRSYVAAAELFVTRSETAADLNFLKWTKWGQEHADRIDPLINGACHDLVNRFSSAGPVEFEKNGQGSG